MLLKLRQRLAQEESGFTLIELLVVMLILGILAAIAIPAFLNQAQKGQDSKAIANVRTAETAAETYAVQSATHDYTGMDNDRPRRARPSRAAPPRSIGWHGSPPSTPPPLPTARLCRFRRAATCSSFPLKA